MFILKWIVKNNYEVIILKNKERPLKEEFDHLSMMNTASATECTGLVTHFSTEDELEAYMDVYSYQAIPTKDKNESQEK
ncbi:MAG: hypothetical protein IJB50_01655 [Clostridia bacterium]|nr:hypothetical protein [Clostridia bacterium]